MNRIKLLKNQICSSVEKAIEANKTEGEQLINGKWRTRDLLYKEGKSKVDWFKIHGWGFKDTEFVLDGRTD